MFHVRTFPNGCEAVDYGLQRDRTYAATTSVRIEHRSFCLAESFWLYCSSVYNNRKSTAPWDPKASNNLRRRTFSYKFYPVRVGTIREIQYGHEATLSLLQWIFHCSPCEHTTLVRMARMQVRKNGGRLLDRPIQGFKTVQRGTSRLEKHTKSHKNGSNTVCFQPQLLVSAKKKVALAAALALSVDARPFSICDDNPGMKHFA